MPEPCLHQRPAIRRGTESETVRLVAGMRMSGSRYQRSSVASSRNFRVSGFIASYSRTFRQDLSAISRPAGSPALCFAPAGSSGAARGKKSTGDFAGSGRGGSTHFGGGFGQVCFLRPAGTTAKLDDHQPRASPTKFFGEENSLHQSQKLNIRREQCWAAVINRMAS